MYIRSRIIATLVVVSLTTTQSLAQSVQQEVRTANQRISELTGLVTELGRKVQQLETRQDERSTALEALMTEVLANLAADRLRQGGDQNAAAAVPSVIDTANKAKDVLDRVSNEAPNSLGVGSDGRPLINSMQECAASALATANDGQSLDPTKGQAITVACNESRARELLAQLEQNRQSAMQTWALCRQAMIASRQMLDENIPQDPMVLSKSDRAALKANLVAIKNPPPEIAGCLSQLQTLVDDLKNMDDSAAALASVLSMAGTICMASGANPYVCGAMFALALLMQMFGGGGGDGDGDGEDGSGTGESGPYGKVPGSNVGEKPAGDTVKPVPAKGLGGNFGTDTAGQLACNVVSGPKLKCELAGNRGVTTTINPRVAVVKNAKGQEALVQAISNNDGKTVGFCTGAPSVAVLELVLIDGGEYFSIGLHPNPGEPTESMVDFTQEPSGLPNNVGAIPENQPENRVKELLKTAC